MLTYTTPIFNSKNKFSKPLWLTGFWVAYMIYESFAVAMATGSFSRIIFYLLHYPVNILLFFLHAFFILPVALKRKKQIFWKLPLLMVMELLLFLAAKFGVDHLIEHIFPTVGSNKIVLDERFIYGGIWRSIYFISLASGYYYLKFYLRERNKREKLQKQFLIKELKERDIQIELNHTKNAFLRAQINPHFLFNTLNFIYSKIHKTDPSAGKALSILAKLMRYALHSGGGQAMIKLGDELGQARLLLELWQIRQGGERTEFIFKIEKGVEDAGFIPLVILTLMENMLKHGELSRKTHPGLLEISRKKGRLKILTRNLYITRANDTGSRSGLKNIHQRLSLSYAGAAKMKHYEKGAYFYVEITAPLSIC